MTGTQNIECFKIPIPFEEGNINNLQLLEHRYSCSAPQH